MKAKKPMICAYAVLIAVLFAILMFPMRAYADLGPKPSITVHCVNLPGGEVYIDLLIGDPPLDEEGTGFYYGKMDDDADAGTYGYDGKRIEILKNYDEDGWRPALVTGTAMPIWGELRCEVFPDGSAGASFDYFGVPDCFKVILVTEDGDVTVTNLIERQALGCVIDIDYAAKSAKITDLQESSSTNEDPAFEEYEISAAQRDPLMQTAVQFAFTLGSTFAIEGLLLIAFGFRLRRNWKPFLSVNLGTQITLTVLAALANIYGGAVFALIACFLLEIVILAAEASLYVVLLKDHSKLRRVLYAVTANAASFTAGLFLLGHSVFGA